MTELKHAQAMNLMANAGLTLEQLLAAHETALVFGRLNLGDLKRLRHCSRRLRWIVGEFTRGRAYVYCPPLLASWRVYALCLRAFGNDVHVRLCSVPRQPVLVRLVQLSQQAGASIDVVLRDPNLQELARLFITSGAALGNVDISASSLDKDGHFNKRRYHCAAILSKVGLSQLVSCRSLDISGHILIVPECLAGLTGLTLLEKLSLKQCQIVGLNGLSSLRSLVSLDVSGNLGLRDIGRLSVLTGLTELRVADCALQDLTSLAGLTRLNTLDISENVQLGKQLTAPDPLTPLAGLGSLSDLSIAGCNLTCADVLSGIQSLRGLNADRNLFGVVTIPSTLTKLDIRDCGPLVQLCTPRGGDISSLTTLRIEMCVPLLVPQMMPTLEALIGATNLQTLRVSKTVLECSQLKFLLDRKNKIRELEISGVSVNAGASGMVLAGVFPSLASRLTSVNFDYSSLGRALLVALAACGQPMVALTSLSMARQLLPIEDMAALTNALQLMPALKALHMASSLDRADCVRSFLNRFNGVRTVLQHAPKTITELDLSENPFCISECRARETLEQIVDALRARENRPKVKISDPTQTPLSINGPPPYTIIGRPRGGGVHAAARQCTS